MLTQNHTPEAGNKYCDVDTLIESLIDWKIYLACGVFADNAAGVIY